MIKFGIRLSQFNERLKALIWRRIGPAFGNIKNFAPGFVGSNTKLSKLKQLKSKIKTQAIKIESKLSKSQTTKNKARVDQLGDEKISNLFSKKRGSMLENELRIASQVQSSHETSLEKENDLLELKLLATEEYIRNFIRETSDQIDRLGIDKLKR